MKIGYVALLALALITAGCDNAPKFDGSSQESLQYSGQKVLDSLDDGQKAELKTAIADTLSYFDTEAALSNDRNYSPVKMRLTFLDGKTAEQVIADAKGYREKKEKLVKDFTNKN